MKQSNFISIRRTITVSNNPQSQISGFTSTEFLEAFVGNGINFVTFLS